MRGDSRVDISARIRGSTCVNATVPPPLQVPSSDHDGLATASMICGFLTLPTCLSTALPAIILGHIAWSKSVREGRPTGRAKLGLIFGYGSFAAIPLIAVIAGLVVPVVMRQRQKADQAACTCQIHQIGVALEEYKNEHGAFPADLRQIEAEGFTTNLDELLALRPAYSGDWLYFPKADIGNPSAPLLVSPPIGRQTIVLRVDLSVQTEHTPKPQAAEMNSENPPVRITPPRPAAR